MKKNTINRNLYGKMSMDNQTKTLIKISIGVILIVLAVYFGTAIATGEIKFGKNEKEKTPAEIQYEEITAGQILNRDDKEYYVLIYSFESTDSSIYLLHRNNFLNASDKNMYMVDIDKKINNSIITKENSNIKKNISNINDLKVNKSSIVKVSNGKITDFAEGQEEVFKYMKSLYN